MDKLILRHFFSDQYGTRGAWLKDGDIYIRTLEPPTPVIPPGDYVLNRYYSPKFGREVLRFEVTWGTAFSLRCLEAHIGNCVHETAGCNLVGLQFGLVDFRESDDPVKRVWGNIPGILDSRKAFEKIMREVTNGTPIHVEGLKL